VNIKLVLAVAMLFGSLAAGLIVGSAPGTETFDASVDNPLEVAMLECAGGYHADARGDCQPIMGIVDSRCPAGSEATAFPNGNDYRCVPIPTGY
jgi:hypothetical protein